MYNIFLSPALPYYNSFTQTLEWDSIKNWAVEIDGQVYYGAHSKEDLEKAMRPQPYRMAYVSYQRRRY